MNIDTIIGIVVVVAIILGAKFIDKPRHQVGQKNKYLTRIENEFENSLNTFANKTLEQMNARHGLNMKLVKLTTELDFMEVDGK